VNNQITLRLASQIVGQYTVMTDALPPTDSANVSLGFPIISVSIPDAVAATQKGVFSFLTKPIDRDALYKAIDEALEQSAPATD
ncbi:hypothetical protein ONJ23_27910, partial [Salmonella enterica subsp. enterica serovar Virginia]|nr:hypothetical protein [Salmonella enterica subsp. enterica serovar Virginia]